LPGGIEENHVNINLGSQLLDRNLNPGCPEYKAGALTTQLQHSVFIFTELAIYIFLIEVLFTFFSSELTLSCPV
jgi:hypothetical protein